jgi:acyl carrier protein
MCLFQEKAERNYHDLFRDFYKYKEANALVNESVDTLIDYFPERSAINIGDFRGNQESKKIVKKLGSEYIENILGRQIFNFEITGSSLENLCFELCEVFNSKVKSIDLLKIYHKIISNQKTQVLDYSIERYSGLAGELAKKLPYQESHLLESHSRIEQDITSQCITEASNCMILSEYVPIYCNLSAQMAKRLKELKDTNKELLRDRAKNCYEAVEGDQEFDNYIVNLDSANAVELLSEIEEKIKMFMNENIHESTTLDYLTLLINKYLEIYRDSLGQLLQAK